MPISLSLSLSGMSITVQQSTVEVSWKKNQIHRPNILDKPSSGRQPGEKNKTKQNKKTRQRLDGWLPPPKLVAVAGGNSLLLSHQSVFKIVPMLKIFVTVKICPVWSRSELGLYMMCVFSVCDVFAFSLGHFVTLRGQV